MLLWKCSVAEFEVAQGLGNAAGVVWEGVWCGREGGRDVCEPTGSRVTLKVGSQYIYIFLRCIAKCPHMSTNHTSCIVTVHKGRIV